MKEVKYKVEDEENDRNFLCWMFNVTFNDLELSNDLFCFKMIKC